ncbi:hypothetical protein MCBMB27_00347 [Methylobacterium phyllosphaerae]|uniref:Uncharacterized protein n=1 Tax=Methylobacterium phyllosphaerae TaxID=418223 RepID=A0AAE8HRQ8_9HYPH|nr:hypothetical protein [Methylobacterium phyllosphaerae]APT29638.1 hypothetical protein MCBMB27_00347 [Methylobacterium phyllosphaerae]SFG91302.1 hypothetical protein SAMN05192567_1104 [Methylobacterium phyllosphaerae]
MSVAITTPDRRYIVVRERLWRCANPDLSEACREALVKRLMTARRDVKHAKQAERAGEAGAAEALTAARAADDAAKIALGERGPVWWTDGAPDLNRHLVRNTPYAPWFAALTAGEPEPR